MNQPPRRQALMWAAFMLSYEVVGALCYAAHAGYLGAIAAGPVSVLIVEETEDRGKLTAGQLDVIASNAPNGLRAYLKEHGEKDPFRLVDKDDSMSQDGEKWQAAFEAAKGQPTPWLVVERNGRVLKSAPMPKDAAETMRQIRRYGG